MDKPHIEKCAKGCVVSERGFQYSALEKMVARDIGRFFTRSALDAYERGSSAFRLQFAEAEGGWRCFAGDGEDSIVGFGPTKADARRELYQESGRRFGKLLLSAPVDAARIERLEEINAELLASLRLAVTVLSSDDPAARAACTLAVLRGTIYNAERGVL